MLPHVDAELYGILSLEATPSEFAFPLLYYRKKVARISPKDKGPNYQDQLPAAKTSYLTLALTVSKQRKKRAFRTPTHFVVYLQPLNESANCMMPSIPNGGETDSLRQEPTVFSLLPA